MAPDQERIRAAERAHDVETEFSNSANKAAIDSGTDTLKALLYLNGGSCVIMLAFLGTLASKSRPVSGFATVLLAFALGAALSVSANAVGYFVNLLIAGTSLAKRRSYEYPFLHDTDSSNSRRRWGERLRYVALVLAFLSLFCFFCGLYLAFHAFKHL